MTSAQKVECVLNREGNVTPQVSHPHRAHRAAEEYPMTFWSSIPLDYHPSISCTPPPFHYVFDTQTIGSLLAWTSSQIPTIKTTSLADLQSSLFDICKIINDLKETVNNLNGVIITFPTEKFGNIVCLFLVLTGVCILLTISYHTEKKNVERKARRLLYDPEGPVHATGEQRVQKSSLPKVQSRIAGAEVKHFNVLTQSWWQYELRGVEHLCEV